MGQSLWMVVDWELWCPCVAWLLGAAACHQRCHSEHSGCHEGGGRCYLRLTSTMAFSPPPSLRVQRALWDRAGLSYDFPVVSVYCCSATGYCWDDGRCHHRVIKQLENCPTHAFTSGHLALDGLNTEMLHKTHFVALLSILLSLLHHLFIYVLTWRLQVIQVDRKYCMCIFKGAFTVTISKLPRMCPGNICIRFCCCNDT